ncbi:ANTH domain-containing protein [Cladochytrium replicatum]|nr:ANTH domain-containing protein [Cladochytrium replicatum]
MYDPYSAYNSSSVRPVVNLKVEDELAIHIRKAISPEESAPKQKHVRACIVYSWDMRSSGSLFVGLKNHPIVGDEILTFKMLITLHKIVRGGHPAVLKDAIRELPWIERLGSGIPSGRGYAVLIRAYIQFLTTKLEYHRSHPEFTGTFDYDEYVSLKGIEDPNEGFETINDLLSLLDKLDSFQKFIFNNFLRGANNECRIAALVPLVEESYGIYQFLVSMLTAMHQVVGSADVLVPLREKFKAAHYALFRFYHECSQLRYLTSLITVPKLSVDPPNFLGGDTPSLPPRVRERSPPPEPELDLAAEREAALRFEQQMMEQERERARLEQQQLEEQRRAQLLLEQQRSQQLMLEQQRQLEMQRQMDTERMRMEMSGQLQSQVEAYRLQAMRDRELIEQYAQKLKMVEGQLQQLSMANNAADGAKDETIRRLQEEVNQWKQKYEALAKLYSQLRKDHLDLLNKLKEMKESGGKIAEEARKEVEKARLMGQSKAAELTEALVEKERFRGEADRVRRQFEDEITRMRREIAEGRDAMVDAVNTKQAEMNALIARFAGEREELERTVQAKQRQAEELLKRLEDLTNETLRIKSTSAEESSVNQAMVDQALFAVQQIQKSAQENEAGLRAQLNKLQLDHLNQMNRMMDNILQASIAKIQEALYEFESATHEGNPAATPEYALSLLEKVKDTCGDFAAAMVKHSQGGDQADAISQSNTFSNALAQLLHNTKGVTRNVAEDAVLEQLIVTVKGATLSACGMFDKVKSSTLGAVEPSQRPEYIYTLSRDTVGRLSGISPLLEKLVPEQLVSVTNVESEDIVDVVDREMRNAANAVDAAARRLAALLSKPLDKVHGSLIDCAVTITNAIAELIRCATASQQEIVAHGKGSSTKGAFYKKNNKWTEGLISAAKSVAVATTFLVEVADGVASGTRSHSLEELVVAAQQVNVSTTQLVAASRVKAIPFSKTQNALEDAAVAVREATKALVRAAKESSRRREEMDADKEVAALGRHEFQIRITEQQVKILELEKELDKANYKLREMRKTGYMDAA